MDTKRIPKLIDYIELNSKQEPQIVKDILYFGKWCLFINCFANFCMIGLASFITSVNNFPKGFELDMTTNSIVGCSIIAMFVLSFFITVPQYRRIVDIIF